jgi:hypothetical protein
MIGNLNLFLIFDLIIFGLSMAVVLMTLILIGVGQDLRRARRAEERMKNALFKKEEELLNQAYEEGGRIIREAIKKGAVIEREAEVNKKEIEELLTRRLSETLEVYGQRMDKVIDGLFANFDERLAKIVEQDINMFHNISSDIKESTNKQMGDFKKMLAEITISQEEEAKRKIENVYQAMLVEVEKARDERLQKLGEEIFNILTSVSLRVLGKSLSVSDHEQLILEALEKAKKEGVFRT